jgi:hypothetical protein
MRFLPSRSQESGRAQNRGAVQLFSGLVLILLLCLPAFSQGNFGRILGTITDQSGAVIPDATVTVTDTQRGVTRTLTTDAAGEYDAPSLTPGTYDVRVEAKGFKTTEHPGIYVGVGKEVRFDLTPQPGEEQQTVTVTAAAPMVETTNATLGGSIENKDINDMPLNGRNYQNLMALRPGVMIQPGGSPWTQSTNNVRPDETVWMVDGVINANFFDARPVANMPSPFTDAATILPMDAIQEFNLQENPKAEYGWKPGAVVDVGIKSGTNALHGSAYAFGRDGGWDARNYFNPVPNLKSPTQLEQYGGVIGGPIKKDKLFFFGGYEALDSSIAVNIGTTAPQIGPAAISNNSCKSGGTGSCATSLPDAIDELQLNGVPLSPVSLKLVGCTVAASCTGGYYLGASATTSSYSSALPNINQSKNGIAKIDYHPNDKNSINGMIFYSKYSGTGEDHPLVDKVFEDIAPFTTWSVVSNWIWIPNSRWVNDFRFGYDRVNYAFNNQDGNVLADGSGLTGGSGYPVDTGVKSPGGLPSIFIQGIGSYLGSAPSIPQSAKSNPYFDFQDNVSYLRGKHAFKFGGEITHIEADSNISTNARGAIFFNGGGTLGGNSTGLEDLLAGVPARGQILIGNPARKVTWKMLAGYFQDDWRIKPRLMLNLGLRYEYHSPMDEANGQFGSFSPTSGMIQQGVGGVGTLWKPDRTNFSPRVGFAWDIKGDGKTVVRGGSSVIYSSFVLLTFVGQFDFQNDGATSLASVPTGALLEVNGVTTQGPGNIRLGGATLPGSALNWNGVVFPQAVPQCGDGIGSDASPCDIMGVDPNLTSPYVVNFNLGVQHAFTNNLSLEVGYVSNIGGNLLGWKDINQLPAGSTTRPFAQFPYLRYINWGSNSEHSNYNSLQVTLTQRVSHGLSFVGGYTYGHGLDNGSLNRLPLLPQNSFDPAAEYASSDFDVRHRFTLTSTYNLPGKKGFGQLLEGWQINGIVNVQTPQPWTVSDSTNNFSGTGEFTDRWDFFGNPSDFRSGPTTIPYCSGFGVTTIGQVDTSGITCSQTNQFGTVSLPSSLGAKCAAVAPAPTTLATGGCYVNGNSVMVPPLANTFGTMGRNLFRDSGFKNLDFSLFKNFSWKERYGAQFRAEVFNLFNHPTVANPYGASNGQLVGSNPSSPGTFGDAGATPDVASGNPLIGSGSARVIQLGLKILF